MNKCQWCSREINNKGSLVSHEKQCKLNPNREYFKKGCGSKQSQFKKGNVPWNKGLVDDVRCKHTDEYKLKATGKASTLEKEAERVRKITENAKQKNGGYRQGSGRGKKGWYHGIFCDSSYELAYVIYCIEHGIDIARNTEKRTYIYDNKTRIYIPDFIVNDEFIEIKGYVTEQWTAKHKYNPDVKVLFENDLKYVFDYVKGKYGKDFTKLYN